MQARNLKWGLCLSVLFALASCTPDDGWIDLFNGRDLQGWRASENPDSIRVEDGVIVCNGPRSHLFYVGSDGNASFRNFEFLAEVKTTPRSNSGIYIHTQFQDGGWPQKGYEAQVLNSKRYGEPGDYVENKLTGSLYGIRNVYKPVVEDGEWFQYRILVQGKTIRIWINDLFLVDYTESDNPPRPAGQENRILSSGTFALQGHDPDSTVYYRKLRVRPLPDDVPSLGTPQPDRELEERLVRFSTENYPLIDLHAHLKEGLTLEQVLERSRLYGITYGLAVNCGLQMNYPDEQSLRTFLDQYQKPAQTYLAFQAEGREWLDLFSTEIQSEFDYVFTDSMTWTNDSGKRMRLWIPEEVEVGDPEKFMEMLVDRTVGIIEEEPVQIYVNPTYLPEEIAELYEELWTEERMDRVIDALVRRGVALEINDRRRIPSQAFIQRAKSAGVKFTLGTNNGGIEDLGHLEYGLQMIERCGLEPTDFWVPRED